ncbi:sensor histidine kinase [Blastococcus xanthinilyticus]|uniref:sensor histidine kinase n=1 Tax=Blastococcus xanthinilyticus TaxID=1564164 RepID=UPI00141320CA|nr:histidine kinase [Blastococcus xanthinilyticus]
MNALLRSVWHEPRPPGPPARAWPDWALVGLALVATVLEGVLRPDLPFRWLQVAVLSALVPLLPWRRTHPLLVLVGWFLALDVLALVTGDGDGLYSAVVGLVLPYALVRWGSGREALAGLAFVLVSAVGLMLVGPTSATDAIGGVAVLASALALGSAARYRARARARELDQVAARERADLARDLHDTVAHHVSAIAIRAQAGLATAAVRPEAATEALRLIEAEASSTLAEMRSMVRTLRRDGPAELAPTPGLADLRRLAGDDGLAVDVGITGDVDAVPPSVAAAVYRLAQESVTNARRHARRATRVDVRLVVDDASVQLRVTDDGEGAPARRDAGFGLPGMAERAALLGGTFDAGPGPEGGWTVTAVLPRRGPA